MIKQLLLNLISATQFTCLPYVSCFEAINRWMCSLWHGQVKICLLPVLDSEACSGERTHIDLQPMTLGFFPLFAVYSRHPSLTSLAIKPTFLPASSGGQPWCSSGQFQSCQYLTETHFSHSLQWWLGYGVLAKYGYDDVVCHINRCSSQG